MRSVLNIESRLSVSNSPMKTILLLFLKHSKYNYRILIFYSNMVHIFIFAVSSKGCEASV